MRIRPTRARSLEVSEADSPIVLRRPDTVTVEVPERYVVAGCWQVVRRIASGSWGTVYEARRIGPSIDLTLDGESTEPPAGTAAPSVAALKFLPAGALTPQQRRRLEEGVDQRPPGCEWAIPIYDVLVNQDQHLMALDGATVVVMELALCSLRDLIGAPEVSGHELNVERLLYETGQAIAAMHGPDHGIGWIHGDLKPSNILVTADAQVRIADLDLVQVTEGSHVYLPFAGSTDYRPPEAFRDDTHQVRRTHDLWAFGVLVHQMLTGGQHPFGSDRLVSRQQALTRYAEGNTDLNLAPGLSRFAQIWTAVISDCLTIDVVARGAHPAAELVARLRDIPGCRAPRTAIHPAHLSRAETSPLPPSDTVQISTGTAMPVGAVPRPFRRRVARRTAAAWVALALVTGMAVGLTLAVFFDLAGATGSSTALPSALPATLQERAGAVHSNTSFGGRDRCGNWRTSGDLTYRSCTHHSKNGYYGGLVIQDLGRYEITEKFTWQNYTANRDGSDLRLESTWSQTVNLAPGDTITVLSLSTTANGTPTDRCTASMGELADSERWARSRFESTDNASPCVLSEEWPLNSADPPPKEAVTIIPGGFRDADCGRWQPADLGSARIQFRSCLYHHADNPNLWNPGAQMRNISAAAGSLDLVVEMRSLRSSIPRSTSIGRQIVASGIIRPGEVRSMPLPYLRFPSDDLDSCIVAVAAPTAPHPGAADPVSSPHRGHSGGACSV